MYQLKHNEAAFQMMSGPFVRQRFEHGKTYAAVPGRYQERFEEICETKKEAARDFETLDDFSQLDADPAGDDTE